MSTNENLWDDTYTHKNLWDWYLDALKWDLDFYKEQYERHIQSSAENPYWLDRETGKKRLLSIELVKKEIKKLTKLLSKGLSDPIPENFSTFRNETFRDRKPHHRGPPFDGSKEEKSLVSNQLASYKETLNTFQIAPAGKKFILDSFLMYWKADYLDKKKHNDTYGLESGYPYLEKPPRNIY